MPDGPRHQVVVLRTDHLGDAVQFSPAFKRLRARFPDSEIVLLGSRVVREVYLRCPCIDRSIRYEELYGPFFKLPGQRLRFRLAHLTRGPRLRRLGLHPDILVDGHRHVPRRHGDLIRILAPKQVAATVAAEDNRRWNDLVTIRVPAWPNGAPLYKERELDFLARLLRAVGCGVDTPLDPEVDLWMADEDRAGLDPVLAPLGGRPFGMIVPGGSWHRRLKLWSPEKYAASAAALAGHGLAAWVVDGGPSEKEDCAAVAAAVRRACPAAIVLDITSSPVRRMFAVMERAALVLAGDNGGLHAAAALGAPTVGIVGAWLGRQFYPWGDPEISRTAMIDVPCRGCNFDCNQTRVICMEDIDPRIVAELAAAAMSAKSRIKGAP
jgi:ADP-heptose:LPS heptosyltransferase